MKNPHALHFLALPMSLRVTYTMTLLVLGLGYLFASIYVFESHAGRDGNPSLSARDLVIAYSGDKSGTKLENALNGPMRNMLPPRERSEIIAWTHSGAKESDYEQKIKPIIEKRCLQCHGGSNPHLPNFSSFEGLSEVAQVDHGMDIFTLVRVSHIHLFGITFIFFIMSVIFSHAYVKPLWFKCIVIAMPFLTIITDVMSWYLTKLWQPFAWVVLISGGLMGVSFAIEWFVSMYQMWFYKLPPELRESGGEVPVISQN